MKKYSLIYFALSSQLVYSHTSIPLDRIQDINCNPTTKIEPISNSHITTSAISTKDLLNRAILTRQFDIAKILLSQYKDENENNPYVILFSEATIAYSEGDYKQAISKFNQILEMNPEITPVRIELAKSYFLDKQYKNAESQFNKVMLKKHLPQEIVELVDLYHFLIKKQNQWQFYINGYYIDNRNVNGSSSDLKIENTGFVKDKNMLPQKAQGIGYNFELSKEANFNNNQYIYFSNYLEGKFHWNNHKYDDIYNRTYLGYKYKTSNQTISLLPFHMRRWYDNKRYQWGNGVRLEYQKNFLRNWQASTVIEYIKQNHFLSANQNGNNKLLSSTLLWQFNPKQFIYIGIDMNKEKTRERQYSSNSIGSRLGWGKEWKYGLTSRFSISISHRKFKDKAVLSGILPLRKVRKDKTYSLNLSIWNQNWQIWGITPKLSFFWKKQKSNISSIYSYAEKDIKMFFEREF